MQESGPGCGASPIASALLVRLRGGSAIGPRWPLFAMQVSRATPTPAMLPNLTRRALEPAGASSGAQAPAPLTARPVPAPLSGATALRPASRQPRSVVLSAAAVDQAPSPAASDDGLVSRRCSARTALRLLLAPHFGSAFNGFLAPGPTACALLLVAGHRGPRPEPPGGCCARYCGSQHPVTERHSRMLVLPALLPAGGCAGRPCPACPT